MLQARIIPIIALTAALLRVQSATAAATPTDLAVRMTATSFRVGLNGVYTVTVSNNGSDATNDTVTVSDTLPNGLSFLSSKGTWTCSADGQSVHCTNPGSLAAGTSSTFAISVSVGSDAVPSVTNRVSVAYAGDTNTANNSTTRTNIVKPGTALATATATAPATATATTRPGTPVRTATPTPTVAPTNTSAVPAVATDLLLTNTTSGRFTVGAIGTYVLTVINVGAVSTNAPITVIDTLPSSLGFVAAAGTGWTCSVVEQTVTCVNPGPLAALAGSTITLNVRIGRTAFPTVTNVATVAYAGDTNIGNNTGRRPTTVRGGSGVPSGPTATATVVGATPTKTATPSPSPGTAASTDLTIGKVTVGPFKAGNTGVYFITVTNIGSATTNAGITVTDVLPPGLSFFSGEGAGWTCSADGQTVSCVNASPLTAGSSIGIMLTVSISDAAVPTVTNVAFVDYPGDTNVANNTARKPTTVRQ